ncbi:MAG: TetR/AcrR family transcriptional regulator C-terminal domain-containing protein [Actinoplanes sp.]
MPDLFLDSVWMRPPKERSGQPALGREQIVRAAIELLDADGLAGLSMRRLGTRLGSGATSLYWHVAHKDELLELVVDEVLGEVYVPEPGDASWRTGASVLAAGMRTMLLRHTWVLGLLGARPTLGPNAMRMGERVVALLSAAGFTGMALSHATSALNAHAIGSATTGAALTTAIRRADMPVRELIDEMKPHLDRLAADHPRYEQWRQENGIAGQNPEQVLDDAFVFGLERLLDGLELWLEQNRA